jgi:hypothetical protein
MNASLSLTDMLKTLKIASPDIDMDWAILEKMARLMHKIDGHTVNSLKYDRLYFRISQRIAAHIEQFLLRATQNDLGQVPSKMPISIGKVPLVVWTHISPSSGLLKVDVLLPKYTNNV